MSASARLAGSSMMRTTAPRRPPRWRPVLRRTGAGVTVLVALALVQGDVPAATPHRTSPRFGRLVAVGDGFLAGAGSGGLVGHGAAGQVDSPVAQLARAARVVVPQPLIAVPGLPPPLAIVDGNGNGQLDAGEVRRPGGGRVGLRTGAATQARNLAVPGEDVTSVLEGLDGGAVAERLQMGQDVNPRDVLKLLLLGPPFDAGMASQVQRTLALAPTFVLLWIGNEDVLDLVRRSDAAAGQLTPAEFGRRFRRLLEGLAMTGAAMAVGNLPDPTGFPLLRHAAGEVTSCRTGDGANVPVEPDALVPIDLDPRLLPSPPCDVVLTAERQARVRATVAAFNAEIAAAVAGVERAGTPVAAVDLAALFDRLAATGVDLDGDGVPELTTRYLGGVFSLDGVHPGRTGNALVTNAIIAAINARFDANIPLVDVARVAVRDPLAHSRLQPDRAPPFGRFDDLQRDAAAVQKQASHAARQMMKLVTRRAGRGRGAHGGAPEPRRLGGVSALPPVQSEGASAADYLMFSGFETGDVREADDNQSCQVVTAPVCTGTRACQLGTTTFPSRLNAGPLGTEGFVRAYHRVEVTALPSPTESCSPILGIDVAGGVPICSADVCVQPDGQVRYRLADRIDGVAIGTPTSSLPAATWRRVEVRIRLLPGASNDECEFRLDGSTVAAATGLDLGDGPLEEAFLSNRQAAYTPPPTPGDWVATYDDVALTVNQFPGPGRVIARQGRAGTPTYAQFPPVGAASIDAAWSQTPASAAARAESPAAGDPLAQTMLVAPFDAGLNPMTPTSVVGACQTWIDANTPAAPDRTYAVRRRLGGTDTDTVLTGIDTAAGPLSDGLLGGFWSRTLATLDAAEIGAAKRGGAGGP